MADVERKTVQPTGEQPKAPAGNTPPKKNVLHKYRSVNYIFTLASLTTTERDNPDTYRGKDLNYVILRSGGKGEEGIKGSAAGDSSSLVGEFNQRSPGRFDMFLDNVQIETIMSRDKNSASTQPTNIEFDVHEPYSINGFIEALQVASQASGYPTYAKASFVLKMEFVGYPDDDGMPDPVIEKYGTRYFPIQFTGVEVNVDEKGTKYHCKAVPIEQAHFGNPSQLKKPIKVQGQTVKDILEDLVKSLTEQVKKEAESEKEKPSGYDEYRVKFPSWDDAKGWVDSPGNNIGNSLVTKITEEKILFTMPDPGTKVQKKYFQPSKQQTTQAGTQTVSNEPRTPVVQFSEGLSVQECIEAIVRDSHCIRDDLEKLMSGQVKEVVKDNMFNYFLIRLETAVKPEIDKIKNRNYYIYTYVVTPYKMLYTKVPGFANQTVDQSTLYKDCIRYYDYIYTGNNLDISNFKLNFNTLFFEAIPAGMGNPQGQPGRDAPAKTDGTEVKKEETSNEATSKGTIATGQQSDAAQTNQQNRSGNQTILSPYAAMAKALHSAITDAKGSMITGEIDILGDPIFLVTGGLGNNNPKPSDGTPRMSNDGEASFTYGDVYVNINFRNPIDIGDDGYYEFDNDLLPFSGVYQVTTVKSEFRTGVFKQTLNIIRQPGQAKPVANPDTTPQSATTPVTDPSKSQKTLPNPDDKVSEDSTPISAESGGIRPDTFNLVSQLGRTIPSPGLPGEMSNFTNVVGGAGTTTPLTPVSGINPNLPGVSRMISPIGISNQPAFGMPLPARAAVGLQQRVYSPGGFVQQQAMGLLKSFGVSGPFAQIANQYLGQQARKLNSIPVLGSGIGIGASVNIVQNNTNPQTTADYNNQQLPDQPTATPTIPGISGNALGYLSNSLTAIPGMTNNAALRVQAATQGNTTDPLAIAAAYGLSQAQLSGLSPNITSNIINQLGNLTKKVPQDTDLNTAVKNGVNLNGLSQDEVAALPPTAPYTAAPQPAPDQRYLNRLSSTGGSSAVARAFGVNSINEVSQTALPADAAQQTTENSPSIISKYASKLGFNNVNSVQDAAVLGLKLYGERQSLMGPTGIPGSLEGGFIGLRNQYGPVNIVGDLGKSAPSVFGSKTSSPLDKIMIR